MYGNKINKKLVGILVIVLLLSVGGMYITLQSKEYELVIEKNFQYLNEANCKEIKALERPRDILEALLEYCYGKSLVEYGEINKPVYETYWEMMNQHGDSRISYVIRKAESLDELEDLKEEVMWDAEDFAYEMDKHYGGFGFEKEKVQQAYAVELETTLLIDEGLTGYEWTNILIVYQYENEWYIDEALDIFDFLEPLDQSEYDTVMEKNDVRINLLLQN